MLNLLIFFYKNFFLNPLFIDCSPPPSGKIYIYMGTGILYTTCGEGKLWCCGLTVGLLTDFETDPDAMIDSSGDGFCFDSTGLEGRGNG